MPTGTKGNEGTVKLTSQDGESFDVPIEVAKISVVVKNILDEDQDDDEDDKEIPLPNVKTAILTKVIEFARHHSTEPMNEIEKVSCSHLYCLIFSIYNKFSF
jgi:S-phase kinase-associated protein 1